MNAQLAVLEAASIKPAGPDTAAKKPLGKRLLDAGLITQAQLDLALREQKRTGKLLGEVLVSLGFVTPDVLTGSLAAETRTRVVDILHTVVDADLLTLVPYDTAKRLRVMPISREGNTLMVAMADAFNVIAIDQLAKLTKLNIDVVSAPEGDILEALERHYAQGCSIEETVDLLMRQGITPVEEDASKESPMVRLVDEILASGLKNRATDIHIEPDEKILRVRMRMDGLLRQEMLIPTPLQAALLARLKLMANLNVTEKRLPQDGRIRFLYGCREVDLRVSTLPTSHGESIVLRILDNSGGGVRLVELGLSQYDQERLLSAIERPHGMILVTGPTGSGKTTTLYASLRQIDTEHRSVFTLEDPIEYALPMVRQTQVRADIGMTFAAGLRALLRQDPDVILVGEIRDTETAQLAVRAALTGHLLFSTLHTNSAAAAIPRLIDMGVERYLLPAALVAVVGQRLVRCICPQCKEEIPDAAAVFDKLRLTYPPTPKPRLWRGRGCRNCRGSGYLGRLALYEVLLVDETIHRLVADNCLLEEIVQHAQAQGMRTLLEDGVAKALAGETTVEEVMRVAR